MRRVRAAAALLLLASLASCTEDPTQPKVRPSFDLAPGSEFSQMTAGIQPTSDFNAFTAATGAVLRTDHADAINLPIAYGWYSANPYIAGGMSIRHSTHPSWWVRLENMTDLLPGIEMTFDGDDSFIVELPNLVSGFGIGMVDNYIDAPSGWGPGIAGSDSRWTVQLFAGCQVVGSFTVDPPKDQAFFIGIRSNVPFSRVQFTETIGGGENDWWGAIYTSATLGAPPLNHPPQVEFPAVLDEGTPFTFASDEDGDPLTSSWWAVDGWDAWYDGQSSTIMIPDEGLGVYEVSATAADLCASVGADQSVEVRNVAPIVTLASAITSLFPGEVYRASGTFTDPGEDTWSATATFGDAPPLPLALDGKSFLLEHVYTQPGPYTVKVAVSDEDGGTGEASLGVTVITTAAGGAALQQQVTAFVTSGALPAQEAKPLLESVQGVVAALARAEPDAALGKLGAFDNKLDALLRSGRITPAAHAALKDYSARLRRTISG